TGLLDAARLRGFTFWLLGDLSGAGYPGAIIAIGAGLLGTAICFFKASALNLMMVGERDAVDFGVELNSTRLVIFIAASLMVGAAVAAGGSVGYVGLVIPHLIRLAMGSDNRLVIPSSAIGGAAFVVLTDMLARSVAAPRELPIGAITALIGAPIFIHLLARK
ncbi:MAG TPA: iron chelate uptake ABC transporter family permease subunit, partial [Pyrinomonadaceae bacterium]|nr:iron chelate uptake ABC transporter family permease subunit [Pyrinomonadaceae bacterium]